MDSSSKQAKRVYLREIEIRYKKHRKSQGAPVSEPLNQSERVYELFQDMQNEAKEKLITISLDNQLKIICFEVVAIGSVSAIHARPIEALRGAIPLNPHGLILVHNHTSGNPAPSEQDIHFTSNLLINTQALGVHFYDHIIIGQQDYFSFADTGLMDKLASSLPEIKV